MRVVGVDLAWGLRRPDGWCVIAGHRQRARVEGFGLWRGDDALMAGLWAQRNRAQSGWVVMDAPLICPNPSGARPVDLEMTRMFRRSHAGCHPANRRLCARPPRLLEKMQAAGWVAAGTRTDERASHQEGRMWRVAEVYPHAALVRFLNLSRVIQYKRGPVAVRRGVFRELQSAVRGLLASHFPEMEVGEHLNKLLETAWTKDVEDQTDALICALVGWWHWKHRGARSQWVGDPRTGLLLLPADGSHIS